MKLIHSKQPRGIVAALLCALAMAAQAQAQPVVAVPPVPQNVLQLSATGTAEVMPDQLTIVLVATREGSDAAAVQAQLKAALEQALAQARGQAVPGQLEVRTGQFMLQPRYGREARIQGWQGRAELILEGSDIEKVTRAAGRLNALNVGSVSFGLSRALAQRTEAQAQQLAVEQFRAKANELSHAFGFTGYGLREVTVQAMEQGMPPRPRMAVSAAMVAEQAPVPVEAGRVTVTVMVNGSVQMR